jgi:hypothetical protein
MDGCTYGRMDCWIDIDFDIKESKIVFKNVIGLPCFHQHIPMQLTR